MFIGDDRNLHYLIRSTGPRKPGVNKVIKESSGSLIYSRKLRTEHRRGKFRWCNSTKSRPLMIPYDTICLFTSYMSEEAIGDSGPVGLLPSFFKYSDEVLVMELAEFLD